jgi:GTP-binding protein
MQDLLDAVVESVPAPKVLDRSAFSMVVTMIEGNEFLGRVCTGRIASGSVKVGDSVVALDLTGKKVDTGRITKIMARKGAVKMELKTATAGDIVQVAGLSKATVSYTICAPEVSCFHLCVCFILVSVYMCAYMRAFMHGVHICVHLCMV